MIYHSILFSFCLMGMASAGVHVCLKGSALHATCSNSTDTKLSSCTIKTEGSITKESKDCKLDLTSDDLKDKGAFKITCAVGDKPFAKDVDMSKDKEKFSACSAGSVPQFTGVTLLLALLVPLLSGVL